MTIIRIKRASRQHRLRGIALLCLAAPLASCIVPLAASRVPAGLAIPLDPSQPFDASTVMPALVAQVLPDAETSKADFKPTMLVSGPAASPFHLRGTAQDALRASLCLTAAIYYEAANETDEGQRAVAQVILNRARHPAYPNTVCGVVYQGTERNDTLCQFTFGCDGSMARLPVASVWSRARRNAQAALSGAVYTPVGLATHYHTLAVNPVWNKALTPTAIVGAHIFFRWPGGAGSPKAFHASYRGNEPTPAPKPKAFAPEAPVDIASLQRVMPLPAEISSTIIARVVSIAPVSADRRYRPGTLPESDIREEYRNSGQWIRR